MVSMGVGDFLHLAVSGTTLVSTAGGGGEGGRGVSLTSVDRTRNVNKFPPMQMTTLPTHTPLPTHNYFAQNVNCMKLKKSWSKWLNRRMNE
jgi:hypothetical protein